jgi:aldose 1-epimerase
VIELTAGDALAVVAPEDGGRLLRLSVGGHELLASVEPADGEPAGFFRGSFPMAPFAGFLAVAEGSGSAHGFVYDRAWEVAQASSTAVELAVELDARWPFGGTVVQRFELSETGLAMTLRIEALRAMPAAVGFHPWFRRDLGGGPVRLELSASGAHAFDAAGMALQTIGAVPPRPWDDVLAGVRSPVLRWPELELALTSSTTTWIVYERRDDAVCVEPISAPAGVVAAGTATASPGAPLTLDFSLHWRTNAPRNR